jgi:hypothetical protein
MFSVFLIIFILQAANSYTHCDSRLLMHASGASPNCSPALPLLPCFFRLPITACLPLLRHLVLHCLRCAPLQ